MNTTTEEKRILTVSRTFAASRERIFAAWTEPAQIKQWFGPETCRVLETEVDLRVGGKYRFHVISEKCGDLHVGGEYREVTPPAKLVYTWQWEGDPDFADRETLITVEFIGAGKSTEVRVTHENLPSDESQTNHEYGWNGCLEKLARHLAA